MLDFADKYLRDALGKAVMAFYESRKELKAPGDDQPTVVSQPRGNRTDLTQVR